MAAMNMEERMALMGIGDLSDQIKPSACYGLNISAQKPIVNLFQGDERLVCQSAEDEQMIINIPFSEAVMIHSINISAMEGEEAPEDAGTESIGSEPRPETARSAFRTEACLTVPKHRDGVLGSGTNCDCH